MSLRRTNAYRVGEAHKQRGPDAPVDIKVSLEPRDRHERRARESALRHQARAVAGLNRFIEACQKAVARYQNPLYRITIPAAASTTGAAEHVDAFRSAIPNIFPGMTVRKVGPRSGGAMLPAMSRKAARRAIAAEAHRRGLEWG